MIPISAHVLNPHTTIAYSKQAREFKFGIYEHYKKIKYKVIAVSRHSETLEEYVVYQQLYGDHIIWIRPLTMFCENVVIDNQEVPRFRYLGDEV